MSNVQDETQKPFEETTYKIIGCAMRVHNKLGPGLKEVLYQRALSVELEEAGLSHVETLGAVNR